MSTSKDYFSIQADSYAKYRPVYPDRLYQEILQYVSQRSVAWDCATGNGQCATVLARYFSSVIATDISARQLAKSKTVTNVQYIQSPAEHTPFTEHTFDLITVAQALHWFEVEAFYTEVRRVSKSGGIIAVWGYGDVFTGTPADEVINRLSHGILENYWPPERKLIDEEYQFLPFPFPVLANSRLYMEKEYTMDELLGYFRSWSSTQLYWQQHGHDPVEHIREALAATWGDAQSKKLMKWPVFMKIGRVEK